MWSKLEEVFKGEGVPVASTEVGHDVIGLLGREVR
jgi:hypothetical protein